jgi:hypothetical protein
MGLIIVTGQHMRHATPLFNKQQLEERREMQQLEVRSHPPENDRHLRLHRRPVRPRIRLHCVLEEEERGDGEEEARDEPENDRAWAGGGIAINVGVAVAVAVTVVSGGGTEPCACGGASFEAVDPSFFELASVLISWKKQHDMQ